MAFQGPGWVLVQPSEGRIAASPPVAAAAAGCWASSAAAV